MALRKIFRLFLQANFFMFMLLIGNHTVFLVQFGINLHLRVFEKAHSCQLNSKLNSQVYDYLYKRPTENNTNTTIQCNYLQIDEFN